MVWPAFSNLSGIDPWKTKCSNCESDENRHREKKLKGVEGKIAQHKKEMESKKRQEDKLLFTLFSCQQKFLFNSNFFIFCLSFSQITCSSIWFKWLGHCEVREEESWGIHTDRARQRQSICMPCGGKKVLARQTVSANPWQQQKQEGCRPGQVGAAWQMEHSDYSLLGREASVW